MTILSQLTDADLWKTYYEYKQDKLLKWEDENLTSFLEKAEYIPIAEDILAGGTFPPPRRSEISKMSSTKKRVVYTYPKKENLVLKLLTYLVIREYDHLFAPNLYSFRANRCARDAMESLAEVPGIGQMWSYKADISDYFNSIPIDRMLPILEQALPDDPELFRFLAGLLTNPLVNDNGTLREERKGIMAGTPISTFLANLYLADLDAHFHATERIYSRYSDDIILFAPSQEELERDVEFIHRHLAEKGLTMNPAKESRTTPGEEWVFLGFAWRNGKIDIAPASVEKLKAKMRRKARALQRWKDRKGKKPAHAARAFIKVFNRKLFETSAEHDLTWARWYFPTITTDESLREIDHYAQSCIRFLATGKHNKSAYNFRYEDMKELGYVSLVNRYYKQQCWDNPEETVVNSKKIVYNA